MPAADPTELLAVAHDAADAAAAIHRRSRGRRLRAVAKSSPTDPVTEVDDAAEAAVLGVLGRARPGDGVLAEEGGAAPGTTGVRWVVDPLDGTVNYLYGYPAHAVSVAAEIDGEVVAGVVIDTAHDERWWAVTGGGAHRDGDRLVLNAGPPLERALVATGFAYDAATRVTQGAVLADLVPVVRDVRRGGSAALDLCWVAAGRVDAYYERGLHPWDRAAGALVVAEAGGTVTGLWSPGDDGWTVAGGSSTHGALQRWLVRRVVVPSKDAPEAPSW